MNFGFARGPRLAFDAATWKTVSTTKGYSLVRDGDQWGVKDPNGAVEKFGSEDRAKKFIENETVAVKSLTP